MLNKLKNIFKPKIKTLNTIYIKKENILKNIENIKNWQKDKYFFPVLKSNAYGHGILQMLEILKGQDFPYLAVDSFPEYQIILKNSKFNILLLNETLGENYKFFNFKRTTFCVYNIETLKVLKSFNKKIKIHIFLNTGMNREGIKEEDLESFLFILKNSKLELEGVMSHFHSINEEGFHKSLKQIFRFKNIFKIIENNGFSPKYKHIGASAAILRMHDDFFNAFRPGLILYGYNPLDFGMKEKTKFLRPALSFESTITCLQEGKRGEGVGYSNNNSRNILRKDFLIGTIPVGYYEGLARNYSNCIKIKYNKNIMSQIGMISMNMANFIAPEGAKVGDKVKIINDNFFSDLSVENISRRTKTSKYEILTRLNGKIRREVI